jgi:hypothetical protein
MRRNFVTSLDQALHLAEHTMTYIESALRGYDDALCCIGIVCDFCIY